MLIKNFYSFFHELFLRYKLLPYLVIFEVSFVLFLFFQAAPTFADPDSFYHTKVAVLLKERGIVRDFPWLQFTVLKDYYIDHHFLYHVVLLPFVSVFPPLIGVKIATILFSSLSILIFYWLLKRLSIRTAFLSTLILMITNAFNFRLNLAKAQALSFIVLLFCIYCLVKKRYILLFFLSYIYVWLYGGWPLIIFVCFVYIGANILYIFFHSWSWRKMRERYMKLVGRHIPHERTIQALPFFKLLGFQYFEFLKIFFAVTLGPILSLVTSPYFPRNLYFYWQQIVEIAIVNYRNVIGVGGEWYAYGKLELIAHASIVFLLFVIACTFFIFTIRKQDEKSLFFLLLTIIFAIFTFRSRRNVEYFIPFSVIFSAMSIEVFLKQVDALGFWREFLVFFKEQKVFLIAIIFPTILIPYIIVRDIFVVKEAYDNGINFHAFEKSSRWLENNTNAGDIVFHSDWDEFPMLFYHNTKNYYIVGLDTTFMYKYDPELYFKYEKVTTGRERVDLVKIIKYDFQASYVLIHYPEHDSFDQIVSSNDSFSAVYQDNEVRIYKVL